MSSEETIDVMRGPAYHSCTHLSKLNSNLTSQSILISGAKNESATKEAGNMNVMGTNNIKTNIKHTTESFIPFFKYIIIHFNPLTGEA